MLPRSSRMLFLCRRVVTVRGRCSAPPAHSAPLFPLLPASLLFVPSLPSQHLQRGSWLHTRHGTQRIDRSSAAAAAAAAFRSPFVSRRGCSAHRCAAEAVPARFVPGLPSLGPGAICVEKRREERKANEQTRAQCELAEAIDSISATKRQRASATKQN